MSKTTNTPKDALFEIEDVLVSQNYDQQVEVKKEPLSVDVRKPNRNTFFRTFSDSANWPTVATVNEQYETYLVAAKLKEAIHGCRSTTLIPWMDRNGGLFIYPMNQPLEGYTPTDWYKTASQGVIQAQKAWVKMASNKKAQNYDLVIAKGDLPPPLWPDPFDMADLVKRAFAERFIADLDHPVIRRLEGQE